VGDKAIEPDLKDAKAYDNRSNTWADKGQLDKAFAYIPIRQYNIHADRLILFLLRRR